MADTDILLTIDLDVKDAIQSADNLSKEVERIFKQRKGPSSPALASLEIQLKQAYQQVNELADRMSELEGTKVVSDEFAELETKLNAVDSAASKLAHKMRMFEESGGDTTSQRYQSWEQEMQKLGNEAQRLTEQMEAMKTAGTDMVNGEETAEYQALQQQLDGCNDKLKLLIVRHQEMGGEGVASVNRLTQALTVLKSGIVKVLTAAKNLAVTVGKKLVSAFQRLRKSSSKGFDIKQLIGYALGIRGLYGLFSKLRSVVKEAFTNLYNDNKTFKKSVDELKGSLATLKNSFASAFQPIVSMAIPYIKQLVDWLTQLMDQIARFTAAALGQKTYMKAIKQTGQAAEKAKRQLAGFDELNVLSSQGNGGGKMFEEVPIDEEKIDLLEKLKEIVAQMESVGAKVGTAIRNALNSVDWDNIRQYTNLIAEGIGNFINGLVRVEGLGEAIGRTFAEVLNTVMQFKQTLFDTIDFEAVGKFLGEIAQSFVDAFNWEGQGELWATELNALFETLKGFTEEFDGLSLGTSLGDMINSFTSGIDWDTINESFAGLAEDISGTLNGLFTEINWTDIGATLSQGISNLIDFAIDFITNLDGEAIGTAIVNFLAGIDWIRLAGELGLLLLSLVEKAVEVLWGLASQLTSNIADFFDYLGCEGIAGFFRGISENLQASVQWIKDVFNKYVVIPIKNFFGIHSPSTLFADFGKMLIQGLVNGIKSALGLLGEILNSLKTKFFEKFQQIKTGIINIVQQLWEGVKAPINSIIGGFEFLVNCVIRAINKMIDAMNGLSFDIPDWVPEIGGKSFGFTIPNLNEVSIPRLAQGAVIPPNQRFLAMLGDQKSGTNVEAPLTTIQEALVGALQQMGFGDSGQPINIYLGTEKIYSEIRRMEKRNILMGG